MLVEIIMVFLRHKCSRRILIPHVRGFEWFWGVLITLIESHMIRMWLKRCWLMLIKQIFRLIVIMGHEGNLVNLLTLLERILACLGL